MIALWIGIFIVSLIVLVKGADWFLNSAEKIGLAMKLSPFIIGVVIVGIGTSLPELMSSLFAVFQNNTEIVLANAIGSNIANILLVIGFAAVIGRTLSVTKDLINLEIPLLASSTGLFLVIVFDKVVTLPEAIILVLACAVYFAYVLLYKEDNQDEPNGEMLLKKEAEKLTSDKIPPAKVTPRDIVMLVLGAAGLVFGAKFLIDSVIELSTILNIATGVIAITAVAIGTSLPELLVSSKAALRGKSEVALGNIFGSNIFNMLIVVGIPGLIKPLMADEPTFAIGLPFLAIVTLLFIISGISKRIHNWEGAFFLLFYIVFCGKLFGLF